MKYTINIRTVILHASLAAAISLSAVTACKKEAAVHRPIALFVVGTVTIERPGEQPRAVAHKDELRTGDSLSTGPRSLLVVQFGPESLVEIEAGSKVRLSSYVKEGVTRFELEQGGIFSRVHRLTKNTGYEVQTRTSIAAVRGTEFRVTTDNGGSVVAVNSGSVAVGRITRENEVKDEQKVEEGKAAVVNNAVTTRPMTDSEKKEFADFEKIKPVENIEGASESDLKKLEDEYRKNTAEVEETGEKKARNVRGIEAGNDDPAAKARLWTGKQVYSSSDTVIVFYKDMPDYRNCWIDISKASDSDGRYRSYNWTYGATQGKMAFSGLQLERGEYEARAHFSKSSSVSKRFRFMVR
jgi:hypothetical protein